MSVIFVHGVTVRQERFEKLLETVKEKITTRRPELKVEGFYWGNMGSSSQYRGASIPGFLEGTRASDPRAAYRVPILEIKQLTSLLLDNPYLELVALRDTEEFDPAGAGFTPLPSNVEARNQRLFMSRPRVTLALQNDHRVPVAVGRAVPSEKLGFMVSNALDLAGRTDRMYGVGDLIDPLTRCLSAALYQATAGQDDPLDTVFVWNKVENLVQHILEQELGGQRGRLGDSLKNIALWTTTMALREGLRQRIMQAMSLFLGDVLAYLAHRDAILQQLEMVVAATVKTSSSPLWLVGHSLGGIICYDYCNQTTQSVERLITIGSQVGLFGEFGVLKSTLDPIGTILQRPDQIGSWLNIYDPDDMLSFLAKPIFSKAVDIEVDTKAPFPISHSEYLNRSEVYEALTKPLQSI